MAKSVDFLTLTYRGYKEFCVNCTCKGHNPPLKVNIDENDCFHFVMNRLQLNEFWMCCLMDQKYFCSENCGKFCQVCRWVKSVYNALNINFFFDFDETQAEQPCLWKVCTSYLDKKIRPFLIRIEIIERTK